MINGGDQEEADLLELRPVLVQRNRLTLKNVTIAVIIVCSCGLAFAGGYYISYASHSHHENKSEKPAPATYHKEIVNSIEANNIKENLKYLTSRQHIAGSPENYEEVLYMKKFYETAGFDHVDVAEYDVLLSYPMKPGYLSVENSKTKKILFNANPTEKRLWKDENIPNIAYPFNGYSPPGDVKGKLVYVNFARAEDFESLAKMKINLTGCIAIARYGKIFRANKAQLAAKAGAIGLFLYTDPKGYSRSNIKYPNSWWLPEDGVQRGTVQLSNGDPLTPGYPSVDGIYRLPQEKAPLPTIPVQPISYGDALPLLKQMDGIKAPEKWQGFLNITYRITMKNDNPNIIRLVTNTKYERRKIHDVIATMKGETEPDRVVLIGNHHDAWVMGACDPSSGTSMLMEIGRTLGEAKRRGYRPRRTIKLCAWDAEEYGLIGSTEWLEQNTHVLMYEAVAYLNVDIAVTGNFTIYSRASGQMPDVLFQSAKQIGDPDEAGKTLYETWRQKTPDENYKQYPRVLLPGSGSDHETFFSRLGIPVVDMSFTYDWNQVGHVSSYPTYHSIHDSFHYMETFIDKEFKYHRTLARYLLQTGLNIADKVIIPFNYSAYARILKACYKSAKKYEEPLTKQNISMGPLKVAIDTFSDAAKQFHKQVGKMDTSSLLRVRTINDRIMHIGRTFIAPEGLPGRPLERHVIYAPSGRNSYKGSCFPGLSDSMFDLLEGGFTDWSVAAQQLSKVVYYIRQATALLEFE